MSKQKNIKIKRSKSRLYKKKKSPAKRVIETLILIIIAGGLIFVGYSAAGPLISHFSGSSETDSGTSLWTPAENTSGDSASGEETSAVDSSETKKAPASSGIGSYLLSETSLQSISALNGTLSSIKNMGYGTVLIPVKNTAGEFLYASSVSYIKDTDLIVGTMPAAQIAAAAKSMGLTPKAVIPTLLDCKSPLYAKDTGYMFTDGTTWWLDNTPANGGKRWIDPALDGTKKFYSDLSRELIGAGFEEVVLSELRYPDFLDYDKTILDPRNFSADRYKALTAVYNASFSASGKKTAAAVNAKDVLDGYGKSYGRTAEILADKSFAGTVYLIVSLSDFGTELKTGDDASIALSPDPVRKSEALISKATEYIGTNVTIVPVIRSEGLSADALANCYKNLTADGE